MIAIVRFISTREVKEILIFAKSEHESLYENILTFSFQRSDHGPTHTPQTRSLIAFK